MLNINIQKEDLLKALSDVQHAISSKPSMPILTGVKISADKEGVTIVGTNNDLSITKTIPLEHKGTEIVSLKKEGSIVLNAKFLLDIVKKAPKTDILITVGKNFVTEIQSGKSSFNLNGLEPEMFPKIPEIEGEIDFSISVKDLKQLISQTILVAATSEMRPILTGVNLTLSSSEIKAVATDSHRLVLKTLSIPAGEEEKNITIPAKSLQELAKILDDPKEQVGIKMSESQIIFQSNNLLLCTRLLEGKYPDTAKLIPDNTTTTVKGNKKELIAALDRCSLLANEKTKIITLEATKGQLILSVTSKEVGNVTEILDDIEIDGEDVKISFSEKFAKDALSTFDKEKVKLEFTGAVRPFLFRCDEDNTLTQLVLPVRT
ncbi:DNA polymerase III subunit beta [Metabacillus fastidiosus]|uniref:Beta sliding clamp n=1 Tax=Metabacillus fastidiosus TaxID=1458 RepID=A0ABU6NTS3_9BACI|nr:DNA polymerase III subunit beta [Metabacillus fastidiosus]